ncbi:MAG: head GIN domain-containing protein [Pseudomonadota bacterium]
MTTKHTRKSAHFCLRTPLVSLALVCLPIFAEADEIRNIENFTGISVGGGINLFVEQGADFKVEVDSSVGATDEVTTVVEGDNLVIRMEKSLFHFGLMNWFATHSVYVTLPRLESLTASGGSDVSVDGVLTGDELVLRTSGGSDIALEVDIDSLDIQSSGGSDIKLSGTTRSIVAQTSGGSDLDAMGLEAKEADLRSSGGSDIQITVTERITANASGGSDIFYKGDPAYEDVNASGGADVTHR